MYKYYKTLPYPVNIRKKDLKMAKYLITQVGGPAGELGAALRYLQYPEGKEDIEKIANIMKNNFPSWDKNIYFKKQNIKYKIVCKLVYYKKINLLKKILKIRS